MEDRLGRILKKTFVVATSEVEELLGGEDGAERPLAGLASRTNLCLCLGLISKGAASQAHIFRRLRARVAHRQEGATFDGDAKIKALVTGLRWMSGDGFARRRAIGAGDPCSRRSAAVPDAISGRSPLAYWPAAYDSASGGETRRAGDRAGDEDAEEQVAPARLWF